MGKGTQQGFWGEETPIERERIVEELKYSVSFHCPDLDISLQIGLHSVSRDSTII